MITNKGFTLIELMIVVAIIGILSMIAMPAYHDYTARTRFAEILTLLQSQKISLVEEYTTTGSCSFRNLPSNEIGSPYIESMNTQGPMSGGTSYVRINGQSYPVICTIVVNMSQKGRDYFKRGNKNASVFYINLATTNGSFVWGCAARTNFAQSVTSADCQISAL